MNKEENQYWSLEDKKEVLKEIRNDSKVIDFIASIMKQQEELQARIDKAIKYIKEKKDVPEWWDTDFIVLLSILKGTDFRTELDKYDE